MWEIWTNELLPKALKSCPNSNKSPNLVTLILALLKLFYKINSVYLIVCLCRLLVLRVSIPVVQLTYLFGFSRFACVGGCTAGLQ